MPHEIPSTSIPPVERLRVIMHILRAPGGCSWDAEQTHESLVTHLIEEAYEVAEAIESGDRDAMVDELGDLLLQPVFHAEIASETGAFSLDDIATAICEKLIRRHPHVFGDSDASNPDEVLAQWDEIKAGEKSGEDGLQKFYLEKANEGLPSLMAAQKIQKKVAKVGFDWPELEPVIAKVKEELEEVEEAVTDGAAEDVAEEIGDLLFSVVNLARKTGHDAEILLHRANVKFVKRFQAVEKSLQDSNTDIMDASLEALDAEWARCKQVEKG